MTSWWFRLVIDCPHKNLGVNVSATYEHCLTWWLWPKKGADPEVKVCQEMKSPTKKQQTDSQ